MSWWSRLKRYLFQRPPEVVPAPDRSVHRGAYLLERQDRYIKRVMRES